MRLVNHRLRVPAHGSIQIRKSPICSLTSLVPTHHLPYLTVAPFAVYDEDRSGNECAMRAVGHHIEENFSEVVSS